MKCNKLLNEAMDTIDPIGSVEYYSGIDKSYVVPTNILGTNADEVGQSVQESYHVSGGTKVGDGAIPLDSLVPTQDVVYSPKLREGVSKDNISVVNKDGKNFLVDGHHRAVDAKIKGDKSIKADFISLDTAKLKDRLPQGDNDFSDLVYRLDADKLIEDFTDDSYMDINKAYREGKDTADVEMFNTLFKESKGNYSDMTYRATWIDPSKLKSLSEGDLLQNDAILSTTKSEYAAEDFFNLRSSMDSTKPTRDRKGLSRVLLDIDNSKRPGYDITEFSRVPEEEEVLIEPNSLLHIQGIRTIDRPDGEITVIELSHLDNEIEDIVKKQGNGIIGKTGILSLIAPILYENKQDTGEQ